MRGEPEPRKKVRCSAAARTASARASSSTTAACAAFALRDDGFETIMVNCNPRRPSRPTTTLRTACTSRPVTLEDVLEIVDREKPWGVIVQYGGQTPLKLARDSPRPGADHRHKRRLDRRRRGPRALPAAPRQAPKLRQPPNRTARSPEEAVKHAEMIGYLPSSCARAMC